MSSFITDAFVQQYSSNVFHLSQQKGSRLRAFVRQESQKGQSAFYDRIGAVSAVKKTSRHGDTPQIDTPNSRRMVTMNDYEWADLVDNQDKLRLLIDPASEYVMAAMWAMGRSMDDEIVAASTGLAYAGQNGQTQVAFPSSQQIVATDGTVGTNLNVQTLRLIKKAFDAADVDESITRHIAFTSSQLYSLLGQTQVTSADYTTVKALVAGEIDTFMGFKFHRIERLGIQSSALPFTKSNGSTTSGALDGNAQGYRQCFAWAQDGILLSVGADMMARISERADKSYANQVYACMSLGATRMEEVKVVQILCNEA